ncbi:MAG: alpha/beta hydrolase [Nitrospinota bacterium]
MKSISVSTTTFKSMIKKAAIVFIVPLLSSCTSYMFHPDQIRYSTPGEFGLNYKDIFLKTPDNIQIHGWFLPSTIDTKGTVFFLHGNAQNISSHIYSVHWLPQNGYNVFLLDYRGFGNSRGAPTVQGAIDDINTGFTWLIQTPLAPEGPIYLLGQSIGASLGIYFVGSNQDVRDKLAGVILDAGFSNFSTIARELFGKFWLTWPFQYPLSMLFACKFNPEDYIQNISPVPVLIMHSNEDKIIPSSHGQRLYRLAGTPKFFKQTRNGHIATFKYNEYRQEVLEFMARFK